jgi:8-amino-7-oxononanoate synthase
MNSRIKQHITQSLNSLSRAGNLRRIPDTDHGSSLYLEYKGRRLLNLASNNYLGLSCSESLKRAAVEAIMRYGTSGSASRLISGNYQILDHLEKLLGEFKNQQKALVVGSGYAANLCILGALAGRGTTVFSDRLNHASITDAVILSRATHVRYRHADMDHLKFLLEKYRENPSKILITDTVFSMDGDLAPLVEMVELCKSHQVLMVVDEAHATGIFGHGRGLARHLGLDGEIDVHMGTFSKALGSYGGYIASHRDIIEIIINRGRPFIYSTALPPAVTGASLAALEQVIRYPEKGKSLLDLAQSLRIFLLGLGFNAGKSSTQIIPVLLGENKQTMLARDLLMDCGIFTGAIRPPTVPEGTARLRLSLRADLGEKELVMIKGAFTILAEKINNNTNGES